MVEQLADGDPLAVRNDARQVTLERVAKTKLSLGSELEHNRRRERLRHAPDPEPLVLPGTADPGGGHVVSIMVGDEDDHTGCTATAQLPSYPFDGRLRRVRAVARAARKHEGKRSEKRLEGKAENAIGTLPAGHH